MRRLAERRADLAACQLAKYVVTGSVREASIISFRAHHILVS